MKSDANTVSQPRLLDAIKQAATLPDLKGVATCADVKQTPEAGWRVERKTPVNLCGASARRSLSERRCATGEDHLEAG